MNVLMVFIGGGLGAAARYGVNTATLRWLGPDLPWGTFAVNVIGSFAMGVAWATLVTHLDDTLPGEVRLLIVTGFLGGFTTFSAYSLDAVSLWERGASGAAIAYVVGSVVLSLAALLAGQALVRSMVS